MENQMYESPDMRTIRRMLLELGIPTYRIGFWQVSVAISLYKKNPTQCVTKELYPNIARQFNCSSWQNVEHTIRNAIRKAWVKRNPIVWDSYFPHTSQIPTNKFFISTLAERL